ncbi:MAG: hypothetical protein R2873_21645 [Caldilineaceae bacterium]
MSTTTIASFEREIQVEVIDEKPLVTRYAGALAWQKVWTYFDVASVLSESEITYGQDRDAARDMMFGMSLGRLVNAHSGRRIAQRFGGEASQEGMERDELLAELVEEPFSQRQLFPLYEQRNGMIWERFNYVRLQQLQTIPGYAPDEKGMLILDDLSVSEAVCQEHGIPATGVGQQSQADGHGVQRRAPALPSPAPTGPGATMSPGHCSPAFHLVCAACPFCTG